MELRMSNNFYNMTAIELAESFVEFFNVEEIFKLYTEWEDDREKILKAKDKLQSSLSAGGLTRELRTKKTKERERLQKKVITSDPRLIQDIRLGTWLESLGVPLEKFNSPRSEERSSAYRKLDKAVADAESFKAMGLPPFSLKRSGIGVSKHFMIMDYRDFAMGLVKDRSRKDSGQAEAQRRAFERVMLNVREHYGDLPEEMKEAAKAVNMAIDFKQRMSIVMADMIDDSIKVIVDQKLSTQSSERFAQLEHDVESARESTVN
jgi:hypothetical protein